MNNFGDGIRGGVCAYLWQGLAGRTSQRSVTRRMAHRLSGGAMFSEHCRSRAMSCRSELGLQETKSLNRFASLVRALGRSRKPCPQVSESLRQEIPAPGLSTVRSSAIARLSVLQLSCKYHHLPAIERRRISRPSCRPQAPGHQRPQGREKKFVNSWEDFSCSTSTGGERYLSVSNDSNANRKDAIAAMYAQIRHQFRW